VGGCVCGWVGLEDETQKWLSVSGAAERQKDILVKAYVRIANKFENLALKFVIVSLTIPQAIYRILISPT
jgi:hypothetical protein